MKLFKPFLILLFVLTSFSLYADYVSVETLTPGQIRFSSKNVRQKITVALKKGDAFYNEKKGIYEGKYLDGKSLFPPSEALPVIRSPSGLVLVDGHHHVMAALALDLPFVPITEIDDLSAYDETDFWLESEKKGYVYPYDLEGKKQIPKAFTELQDDANRFFVGATARKFLENKEISSSFGAEYPLWIKIGKDIPFIEFRIADVLKENGFIYCYELGEMPPEEWVEKARKILLENPINGLRVVPERLHFSELDLSNY